jgi:HAMP domain-containing protein/CheY-like chemotaxis protein/signal transduction histidine kinase
MDTPNLVDSGADEGLAPSLLLAGLRALRKGDFSIRLPQDRTGIAGEIAHAFNEAVEMNQAMQAELARISRVVGKDGKLAQRAEGAVHGGGWRDCIDSVNALIDDLVQPTHEVARVIGGVAAGDLSQKMLLAIDERRLRGEFLSNAKVVNGMVEQLAAFAAEVTRVAREVGTEGKLGGQAVVRGLAGTWKDLTESVNLMAGNLTAQVRNIGEVTTAVAKGDLSKKITVDVKGEILELKNTINTMVDQLNAFASEVTRVAREVGTEGKLGGQAHVPDVGGTWKDLTDNVNSMASNLTAQVRNIAEVTTAVANGDLSKKITVDVKGEILELKDTINTMVEQLNAFASEVTRVAREVGSEGKLGGQALVRGVAGTWKDLTDNVNSMASNLTGQVRNIAEVTTAVARGDLSKKITVDVKGEILELKNTINTMVEQLNAFASEVTRVAREVGSEGKLGGQALVRGVGGTWKDLTDNVNSMASNLTGQVRNIAEVTTAVARGDLSKKITVDVKGEILELKNTINTMVDQLNAFASEVTRVAREVGSHGRLGGQALVRGVAGTWKDLTDNVNSMASNLTAQVRGIAEVTTAVARGDLSKKITVDVRGEILELKNTINTMVDQLNAFASEVTRVAREVGTEGKLGGQALVPGVGGTWRDLTDSVNSMASNLTAQVRNIAEVATAVARGDLTKKVTADVKGEILELKDTINTMADQLNAFASEVTRVAREVGTDGKLGGQAEVPGVGGTWKDLTESVNGMAGNLTGQVRNIAEVTTAVARGDLSRKITVDVKGEILELKNTINTMVDQLNAFAAEVTRVAREVGSEGKLGGQALVRGVAGTWKDLTDSVNSMASNLTGQVRNIAEVTTAVARGDLSKKITVDVKGEILELKDTINTMVVQLNAFASEVTRVAREVGTEGKLGGQALVPGVAGTWKDLTDNVNWMASNLTAQVRGIAKVVTAVAGGDLTRKLALEARGEIAELAETINSMTDTLATFAEQVTTVAREVGVEGKLGGQARVPGAAGTWRDLTDNVNQLAGNLTTQVRAIGDVATAVTKGDLTRSITVEASGEVAALKDNINEMIRNLRETTRKTTEQDWLKTNLARFTRMLQGQRDLFTVAQQILSELGPLVDALHGAFFLAGRDGDATTLKLLGRYAYVDRPGVPTTFRLGEGLVGQCAYEKRKILVDDVPSDYIRIGSGLGEATPRQLIVLPVLFEGQVNAVIELACLTGLSDIHQTFLDQLTESIGIVVNTIAAGMRTESLLTQSQTLTQELQSQQEELRRTNDQLGEKAKLLEIKNREVELAKEELEEKAEQLALTSKYKSEFLANMSHELRTPLNSLLILSRMLSDNPDGNLSLKQVEFARTIHGAGTDLLALINDILDLSKIESGTMTVDATQVAFRELGEYVEQNFRHVAQQKSLDFGIRLAPDLPPTFTTDPKRLQQILKNLLSNAFKFTDRGQVTLEISRATGGWSRDHAILQRAGEVLAFTVGDTGIGIAPEKKRIIFEAFQQADGTTSRRYGGTGLGLSISRELSRLLGGEITVMSDVGKGSSFTLFLPRTYVAESQAATVPRRAQVGEVLYPRPPVVASTPPVAVADDREQVAPGDRVLLVIEDDAAFASAVVDAARGKGFKVVRASDGEAGLSFARRLRPSAISLDLRLPDLDGWTVLDQLKHDPATRHIPVEIISADDQRSRGLKMGAFGYVTKPAAPETVSGALGEVASFLAAPRRRLLVVEDDEQARHSIQALVGGPSTEIVAVASGEQALEALQRQSFRCMVVDLGLPDMGGLDLLQRINQKESLRDFPIIVYTGRELPKDEEVKLRALAESIIIKDVRSPQRLLDEVTLYLHLPEASLPDTQRRMLQELHRTTPVLAGTTLLVIDDDVRNIFAVTSALERHGARVLYAENGREGLAVLEQNPGLHAVLADIMMPEMDGYEVMRRIRLDDRFRTLPIIAVTAKAMRADREKCLQAGASDYIAKPVDTDQLLSLLRVWLVR